MPPETVHPLKYLYTYDVSSRLGIFRLIILFRILSVFSFYFASSHDHQHHGRIISNLRIKISSRTRVAKIIKSYPSFFYVRKHFFHISTLNAEQFHWYHGSSTILFNTRNKDDIEAMNLKSSKPDVFEGQRNFMAVNTWFFNIEQYLILTKLICPGFPISDENCISFASSFLNGTGSV